MKNSTPFYNIIITQDKILKYDIDIYITIKYNLIKDNVIIFLLGGLNTMKLTKTNPQHESLEVY